MFDWFSASEDQSPQKDESEIRHSEFDADASSLVEAIHRSQAVIEFEPDGTILTANDNFLETMGYDLEEIEGEHHRLFVEDDHARSEEYRAFWETLRDGEYQEGRRKRLAKDGREVWLQATYNPVLGPDGEVRKIVKFADDVTEQVRTKQELAERREVLSERVDTLLDAMQRFSEGDLTVRVEADAEGDVRRLFEGFNDAVATMRRAIGRVVEAVSTAGATAEQVSASAEQLSAGAEQQSSQAEEVAAAVEEMSRTIAENAETVTETNNLAQENRKTARKNGQVVLQAVDKMEDIGAAVGESADQIEKLHAASEQIGDIVETIDEIADQTNMLAINAAIEAARAGGSGSTEAGQSFAVVAEEIQELAKRADDATDEIAETIDDIQVETRAAVESMEAGQEEVTEGIELAREAREAFEEIVEGTEEISDRVEEVAAATEEQSTTSEQISQSAESISTVSRQNAEATRDIAQAIGELKDASADARRLTEAFKIGGGASTDAPSEASGGLETSGRPPAGDGAPPVGDGTAGNGTLGSTGGK